MVIRYVVIFLILPLLGCASFQNYRVKQKLPPLEWVYIPGGSFLMGDFERERDEDALPRHLVILDEFYLNKYEITYAQFDTYAELFGFPLPDDEGFGRGDRAVVNVAWDEAKAFCEYYGGRLPTEAEWEFAARDGGKRSVYYGTNDILKIDEYIRHKRNSVEYSFYVGSKKSNRLGLYDMGGNVYEWIGNFYAIYPESGKEPKWMDYSSYDLRLIRGGSFNSWITKTYTRAAKPYDDHSTQTGFRCARDK